MSETAIRNYDHLAGLWSIEGWIPEAAAQLARAHYGAYMVQRHDGLRIITLNTDLWYKYVAFLVDSMLPIDLCCRANWYNYINMTTSDPSGILRFLTDELQEAEDAGDRGEYLLNLVQLASSSMCL